MKTLHLALAAVYRLEVAETTSEWWDSQTDSFKEQYMKDHPKSRFARAARAEQEGKGKHATKYQELFDKHFYDSKKTGGKGTEEEKKVALPKPELRNETFLKDADKAIRQYTEVDTKSLDDASRKNLRLLDSALNKKISALARQKKQIRKQQAGLNNRLKKAATKEEKALLRKEISKLETSHNRLSKQEEILTGKHEALITKHPAVLKTINTIRKQSKDRASKKSKILTLNKELTKLKAQLVKVQKTFDNAADTGLRRQARLKLKELKTEISNRLKALKTLSKV